MVHFLSLLVFFSFSCLVASSPASFYQFIHYSPTFMCQKHLSQTSSFSFFISNMSNAGEPSDVFVLNSFHPSFPWRRKNSTIFSSATFSCSSFWSHYRLLDLFHYSHWCIQARETKSTLKNKRAASKRSLASASFRGVSVGVKRSSPFLFSCSNVSTIGKSIKTKNSVASLSTYV